MIGLVIAMESEAKPFIERFGVGREEISGRSFFRLDIRGTQAVLAISGIGKVNAAFTAGLLVHAYDPEVILNCGVSGGVGAGLSIGEVIAVKSCVQHDVDTSALGDPVGFVSTVNTVFFPTDDELRGAFCRLTGAREGVAASGEQFVADKDKKNAIVERFGATVCDMESGAVAQSALISGKKYLCIRAVSDLADGSAPNDFPAFVADASEKLCDAIEKFLLTSFTADRP